MQLVDICPIDETNRKLAFRQKYIKSVIGMQLSCM